MSEQPDQTSKSKAISSDEFILLSTTCALLGSAKRILSFNVLFAAVGFYYVQNQMFEFFLVTALGLWVAYLQMRIAFDELLFSQLQQTLSTSQLDQGLVSLKLCKQPLNVSITKRCQGATQLWKKLMLSTAIQGFLIVFVHLSLS